MLTRARLSVGVAVMFAVVLSVAGCGSDDDPPGDETPTEANPASVFCVDQGGEVEIVEESDGEVGYCLLPDGTRVDEWEYYRSNATVPTSES